MQDNQYLEIKLGLSVYVENQLHERSYAGSDAGLSLSRLFMQVPKGSVLLDIYLHGDTMFNVLQLQRLDTELRELAESNSDAGDDVQVIQSLIDTAIRKRGYLWICGD